MRWDSSCRGASAAILKGKASEITETFEALIRALDEIERRILVTGICLASIHVPAGIIWEERGKQQLTASPTANDFVCPHC